MKTKEDCKERFKLTLDQWKVMTEQEIKTIEQDLLDLVIKGFLDYYKVNDGREERL